MTQSAAGTSPLTPPVAPPLSNPDESFSRRFESLAPAPAPLSFLHQNQTPPSPSPSHLFNPSPLPTTSSWPFCRTLFPFPFPVAAQFAGASRTQPANPTRRPISLSHVRARASSPTPTGDPTRASGEHGAPRRRPAPAGAPPRHRRHRLGRVAGRVGRGGLPAAAATASHPAAHRGGEAGRVRGRGGDGAAVRELEDGGGGQQPGAVGGRARGLRAARARLPHRPRLPLRPRPSRKGGLRLRPRHSRRRHRHERSRRRRLGLRHRRDAALQPPLLRAARIRAGAVRPPRVRPVGGDGGGAGDPLQPPPLQGGARPRLQDLPAHRPHRGPPGRHRRQPQETGVPRVGQAHSQGSSRPGENGDGLQVGEEEGDGGGGVQDPGQLGRPVERPTRLLHERPFLQAPQPNVLHPLTPQSKHDRWA